MFLPVQHFPRVIKKGTHSKIFISCLHSHGPLKIGSPGLPCQVWIEESGTRWLLQLLGPSLHGASHSHLSQWSSHLPGCCKSKYHEWDPQIRVLLLILSNYPPLIGNSFSTTGGIILSRSQGFQNSNPGRNLEGIQNSNPGGSHIQLHRTSNFHSVSQDW